VGREDTGRERVRAVTDGHAHLVIEETDLIQSRHEVGGDLAPLEAAVAGDQHHAGAAAAVGQLVAADDPAGERIEEMDRAKRSPDASRLAFPAPAAVDGVPDD